MRFPGINFRDSSSEDTIAIMKLKSLLGGGALAGIRILIFRNWNIKNVSDLAVYGCMPFESPLFSLLSLLKYLSFWRKGRRAAGTWLNSDSTSLVEGRERERIRINSTYFLVLNQRSAPGLAFEEEGGKKAKGKAAAAAAAAGDAAGGARALSL